MNEYDSKIGVMEHKYYINKFMGVLIQELIKRANHHDDSKLSEHEKPYFDTYEPKLRGASFGSDEYKQFLVDLKPALDHHYGNERHHPEHFSNGIQDMNLIDLMEMLIDWKASSLRQQNGNIIKSIKINQERFKYSNELAEILENTVIFIDNLNIK